MKLKYKLLAGYLILIAFISIVLILFLFQLRDIDQIIRIRIEKDVQEVIDLTHQQHILEKLYDQYILYLISSDRVEKNQKGLKSSSGDYNKNWALYKKRRTIQFKKYSIPFIGSLINKYISPSEDLKSDLMKKSIEKDCEGLWNLAQKSIDSGLNSNGKQIPDLKKPINQLREKLISLGDLIGEQTKQSGINMRERAGFLQKIIISVFFSSLFISLVTAFFIAKKLSSPIEELKNGIEQIAIQNFNVKIQKKSNDEIGELASAFEQMALRLKKNDEFKSAILSQFSHEMKSPLGAIKQAAKLLESTISEDAPKDQKRLISIIQGNNDNLFRLIGNVLKTAEIEAEKIKLDQKRENIVKLFTNTIMLLSPSIKEKNIKVDLTFSSEKIECEIDSERMKEVFYNLISNSIKFSPANSNFDISLIEKNQNAVLKIKDQGIGIPAKEIPYIFERMYRASNSISISVKGTGLGLYISSQIIKAHGGKIEVSSKEGEGSEFTIFIPKEKQKVFTGERV